ncbi:hypothetical protein GCM10027161_59750 [Microbispora hainanensis]
MPLGLRIGSPGRRQASDEAYDPLERHEAAITPSSSPLMEPPPTAGPDVAPNADDVAGKTGKGRDSIAHPHQSLARFSTYLDKI